MRKHLMRGTAASALIFAAMNAAPAFAQAADVTDQAIEGNAIIVTAQRVEQNLQDVPISVSVIGGDELDSRQIDSFEQLQFVAPGIAFTNGVNARQSSSTIRGIGTSLFNTGIEGSVAIAVDGVILGREGAGIFDFNDVERVEVLRGPQGTLFGKNASAGVISIVTKGPTEDLQVEFEVGYGSFDEVNLYGAVSGPVTDNLLARFSGYRNTRDGFVENVNPNAPQDFVNDRDEFGFRGKLQAIAGDFDFILGGDFSRRDQNSGALTLRSVSGGGPGRGLLGFGVPVTGPQSIALGIESGPENRELASDQVFTAEAESYGGYLEISGPLGSHDLVSITSYREWTSIDNNDADLIPLPFLSENSGDLAQSQFSQEVRIVSPRANRFRYTLGAFYFEQEIDADTLQAGTAGLDLLGALPPGLILGTAFNEVIEEQNYALFGQAEFDVTDQLTLIGGLRVLQSNISGSQVRNVAPDAVGPFVGQNADGTVLVADEEDTAVVWRLGAQYFVNDDINLFATVTRGYKSAGLVTGLSSNAVTPGGNDLPTVDPEIPLQFEAGVRSVFLDGDLTVNLTGFYTRVDDFQAQTLVPQDSGVPLFLVANAGEVETKGFEANITYRPAGGLTLSSAIAYTDATFAEFDNAPCYNLQPVGPNECIDADGNGTGDFQNLAGGDLGQSPNWVINSLARYDFNPTDTVDAFVQVGVQHRSSTVSGNNGDPGTIIPAYTLIDAQIGANFANDRIGVTLFARNLTDEQFPESIVSTPFDTGGFSQFLSFEALQTFGAQVTFRY